MSDRFEKFQRALAMFCAIVLFFTAFNGTPVFEIFAVGPEIQILHDEAPVTEVKLEQDGKIRLTTQGDVADKAAYFWQIRDPANKDLWVNITGANSDSLWVTYALVGSMLQENGKAFLRCCVKEGEEMICSEPVSVTVSFHAEVTPEEPETVEMGEAPMLFSMRTGTEETFTTHSIIINYLFDNNALAFEPYGATVAHGSDFKDIITSPTVVGYKPFRRVGTEYIDASTVELNLTNIQEDVIINVVYEPTLVNFSVHHHLQNLYDDEYSLHYDYITTSQAITGTVVGDGLAMTEDALPGFRPLAYEKLTVAADGSTVVEIRYDRNYYLIDFDMNGGYGTEPVYTRYGSAVGANDPIRHGYVFDGWELVSYDGRTPTAEEASKYAISSTNTISVPAANLKYRARWITQQTTYTVVFWKENANDNGYSYWGYLDNIGALSGSIVDAQDWADRLPDVDDEQYFTFNSEKSDKGVLVEGDGSSVVNVYYTRNYYSLTFKATGKCTIPEKHTHSDACYDMVCGGGSHTHTDDCGSTLLCEITEHTAHTDACISCGLAEHIHGSADCDCKLTEHTHTVSCWDKVGDRQTNVTGAPKNPQQGQIYRRRSGYSYNYYIYLFGSWYKHNGSNLTNNSILKSDCKLDEHTHGTDCSCDVTAHTHSDSCYKDTLHTHDADCYTYSCGEQAHTHSNACKRLKCGITEGHTHSGNCTNASKENTVKVVYRKYQQSIEDLWPVTDDNGKVYNSGERWEPSDSSYYSAVLVYLSRMTPDSFTLKLNTANYDNYKMQYYLEVLPNQPYDVTVNNRNYKLSHTVNAKYNYITYDEDFYEISGFVRASSDPKFGSNNQLDINGGGTVKFYYNRSTDNPLTFSNNGIILDDKTVAQNMFEIPLKDKYFVPEYPSNLEPGAYAFAGWYTSPGCFAGTEVDWDTIIMPEGGLQLYAKWSPITHTIRVFKDATLQEQIGPDQIVDHKAFAHAPEGNITNGNYVFQGWFYKDIVDGKEVEKAFVFTGIPVTEDLDIYAKWSSHISVEYKIEYKLYATGETIADPTVGMAIAGNNKTFPAKAGDQLYVGYQTGYYPLVNSHTITMSADGTHTFTFYYVYVESMPYEVRYVDALTGAVLVDTKLVRDNNLSVVTETFQRVDGKMPDAYQKRLVLVADGVDTDGNGILDENTITFYYNTDSEHAYYRVVHYIQNMGGDDYREYLSKEAVGNIGESYSFEALTLAGFTFNGALTKINGVVQPANGNKVSATLGSSGLLVELYYERNTVPYIVRYLDNLTGEEIYTTKTSSGVFGEQVAEYALDLKELGYELIGEEVRLLTLSANEDYNVLEFRYQERTVSLKYQVVGPDGCGTLSQMSQNVQAISGKANGSVPMAAEGFLFTGWYLDSACTVPVPESWVNSADHKLTPVKTGAVWQDTTYYAKFIALETNLTIQVQGADDRDAMQTFLFQIVGKPGTETADVKLTVAITGNGSVTITQVPTGEYTITELESWAWRYDSTEAVREMNLQYSETGHTVVFAHNRDQGKWLDGNAVENNLFN